MTQHEKILNYIDVHGSITPMEAYEHLHITKLATRVSEMIQMGIDFTKVPESHVNAAGERSHYMRYRRVD